MNPGTQVYIDHALLPDILAGIIVNTSGATVTVAAETLRRPIAGVIPISQNPGAQHLNPNHTVVCWPQTVGKEPPTVEEKPPAEPISNREPTTVYRRDLARNRQKSRKVTRGGESG